MNIHDMYMYDVYKCSCFIRWNTIGWPRKISEQIEHTEKQLDDDEQKFQRNLQSDQANFDDRLDTLEVKIERMCTRFLIMHEELHVHVHTFSNILVNPTINFRSSVLDFLETLTLAEHKKLQMRFDVWLRI